MKMGEGDLYAGGVKSLLLLKDGKLVVGTGDGTIEVVEIINRKNSRPQKPSKFPNTPQIFTVSYSSLFLMDLLRKRDMKYFTMIKERYSVTVTRENSYGEKYSI